MSKVFSFRLDGNNPREAQAREVIDAWVSKGYSMRHLIIDALLFLRNREDHENSILDALEQIKNLFSEKGWYEKVESSPVNNNLPDSFIESLKLSAKPGQRVEQ